MSTAITQAEQNLVLLRSTDLSISEIAGRLAFNPAIYYLIRPGLHACSF